MKSLLLATLIGLLMDVCEEEAQKEAVREKAKDESVASLGEKFTILDPNLTMIWVKLGTFMTVETKRAVRTQYQVIQMKR